MKIKHKTKVISGLLLLILPIVSIPQTISASAANDKGPDVSAQAAYFYEANSGTVIYQKNENKRMGPASTTKIVTAILAIESTRLDDTVVITDEMTGIEGSSLYLRTGELLTVQDLLYGLMLRSANDAAIALAVHTAGTVDAFVNEMNALAERLGLKDTHFENPHGLDGKEHYTTARELAIITAYATRNPTFREIVSTKKTIIARGTESARLVVNHNKLLSGYDGVVGVKTGFTKKCGRTLVSAYEEDGAYLIGVTLNAPDDWSDHTRLYDYARSTYQMTVALSPLEYTRRIGVLGGDCDTVEVANTEGSSLYELKSNTPFSISVSLPRILVAPILEGEEVGELLICYADATSVRIPLLCMRAVPKRKQHFFK